LTDISKDGILLFPFLYSPDKEFAVFLDFFFFFVRGQRGFFILGIAQECRIYCFTLF